MSFYAVINKYMYSIVHVMYSKFFFAQTTPATWEVIYINWGWLFQMRIFYSVKVKNLPI